MNTFSTSASLWFGWETFKKRPWFLIGATLVVLVFLWIINLIQNIQNDSGLLQLVIFLAFLAASTLVDMGFTAFFLRAHDAIVQVSLHDLWHPRSFWQYFAVSILTGLCVIFGLILLIVPGLILLTMLAFVKLLVIDRDLGPIKAMKESVRITRGNRLELFLLLVVVIVMNILGAIALFVGLLVTIPVSAIALVHAYRMLSPASPGESVSKNSGAHPHTTQIPRAPHTSAI